MPSTMQLIAINNYIGRASSYKIGTVKFVGHMIVCANKIQLNVYKMNTCHKNNGLN